MSHCLACAGYDESEQLAIEAAGREHRASMDHIRYQEANGIALALTLDTSSWFRHEAEATARALGF